jgi:AcrR family transcriptional regulator
MNRNSNSYSRQTEAKSGPRGVRPALQKRSRESRDRLFGAGRQLLEQMDLDAISIADLAKKAGSSVGAFYLRFENKDTFFRAMIDDMLSSEQAALEAIHQDTREGSIVEAFVKKTIQSFRRNTGVLRSALRKGMEDPSVWEPIRQYWQTESDILVKKLRTALARRLSIDEELRIRFAAQVLYGTLINALLHRPAPLLLESDRLETELIRVVRSTMSLKGI